MAVALVVLAVAVYLNALPHPFVYDDLPLVVKNPAIRSMTNIPEIVGIGFDGLSVNARWTRHVTHAVEYSVAGLWAPLYHGTNVFLHAMVGLLIFTFVSSLARNEMVGWWSAALFVVHPLTTEAVAHVSGRRDLLAAFFALGGLVFLERWTRIGGLGRAVIAFVCFWIAAFSKEVALLAPPAFILIDGFSHLRERAAAGHGAGAISQLLVLARRRIGLWSALIAFTVAVAALLLFGPEKGLGLRGLPSFYETYGSGLGLVDHLRVMGLAIRLSLLPIGQTADYSFDALQLEQPGLPVIAAVDLLFLLAALVVTGVGLWRRNWWGFGGAWFFFFFSVHTGVIIPWHEIFAERFLYLPLIGLTTAVAGVAVGLANRSPRPTALVAAGFALIGVLGLGTVLRNEAWSSSEALWSDAAARYPNCARAQKGLGDAKLADGDAETALVHYKRAAEILPRFRDARVAVAVAQAARMQLALALETIDAVLVEWPEEPKAWNLRGYLNQSLGDEDAAFADFEKAIAAEPRFAEGYNNLARIYVDKGEFDDAIRMYETALRYDPSLIAALRNLALVYRNAYQDEIQAMRYEARADAILANR